MKYFFMDKKIVYLITSLIFFVVGMFLIINSKINITGAIIGSPVSVSTSLILGFIFVLIALLVSAKVRRKMKLESMLKAHIFANLFMGSKPGYHPHVGSHPHKTYNDLITEVQRSKYIRNRFSEGEVRESVNELIRRGYLEKKGTGKYYRVIIKEKKAPVAARFTLTEIAPNLSKQVKERIKEYFRRSKEEKTKKYKNK